MVGVGELILIRRRLDRSQLRPPGSAPEPAADVALDRLAVDAFLADARDEHLHRHLPLAESGDLDRGGEVGGGVLDGVVHVVGGDVHRQADTVIADLLDRGSHPGIEPDPVRAGPQTTVFHSLQVRSAPVDLETAIRTRRTHKAYGRTPVPGQTLLELLDLARYAPNHRLTEPWRFRVLGPRALERLKAAADEKERPKLDRAPTLVVASAALSGDPRQD